MGSRKASTVEPQVRGIERDRLERWESGRCESVPKFMVGA
jgi:hypothetical protein